MIVRGSGDSWAPSGQTFAMHAGSTFLTCVAGSLISLVTFFLLAERNADAPSGVRAAR